VYLAEPDLRSFVNPICLSFPSFNSLVISLSLSLSCVSVSGSVPPSLRPSLYLFHLFSFLSLSLSLSNTHTTLQQNILLELPGPGSAYNPHQIIFDRLHNAEGGLGKDIPVLVWKMVEAVNGPEGLTLFRKALSARLRIIQRHSSLKLPTDDNVNLKRGDELRSILKVRLSIWHLKILLLGFV